MSNLQAGKPALVQYATLHRMSVLSHMAMRGTYEEETEAFRSEQVS